LPRALLEAFGKDYFQKKIISLPRALLEALGKDYLCLELGLAALGKVAVSPPTP